MKVQTPDKDQRKLKETNMVQVIAGCSTEGETVSINGIPQHPDPIQHSCMIIIQLYDYYTVVYIYICTDNYMKITLPSIVDLII